MRKSINTNVLFFTIIFSIISCSNTSSTKISTEETKEKENTFPKLEIINKAQITILSVSLEGYNFSDLNLKQNQSIILELKDGMPEGYDNVRVSIRYRPYRVSNNPVPPILVNLSFTNGYITSLTIRDRTTPRTSNGV